MRLRSPGRMFLIRYRKPADKLSVPDFLFGAAMGACVMLIVCVFVNDRQEAERLERQRERDKATEISTPPPAPSQERRPIYADDDTVDIRYSIDLPAEKRCWTSVAVSPSDRFI